MAKDVAQSIIKAASVLSLFKEQDMWGISEISRRLDYPIATVHRILASLETVGFVTQDSVSSKYMLGVELHLLGGHVKVTSILEQKSRPILNEFAHRINETVHLSICDVDAALAIASVESTWEVSALPHVGQSKSLYATSVGKCMLAYNCDGCYARLKSSAQQFIKYTANTVSNMDELERALENVRRDGFAIDNEEVEENLICVGAPIFSGKKCIAAIGCSIPKNRYIGRENEIKEEVVLAAKRISEKF